MVLKVAFAQVGKLQYELIEPVSGAVDIYRDGLAGGEAMRLHHVAMRVEASAAMRLMHQLVTPLAREAATANA